jgi:hypothetical protein
LFVSNYKITKKSLHTFLGQYPLDVTDGIGAGGFSLETPYGKTFKVNYRLFTEDESENLEEIRLNE